MLQPEPRPIWEALAAVLGRQIAQDALLLWRYERHRGALRLLAASPKGVVAGGEIIAADEGLCRLADRRLDLLVQPSAAVGGGPIAAHLSQLDLRVAATAVAGQDGDDTYLLTAAFSQRWEAVAPHCQVVTALAAYLRHCGEVVLPSARECHWWAAQSRAVRRWRKDCRPSALRTVHDLNEVLLDARPRGGASAGLPDAAGEAALATAHRAADLVTRLETVYGTAAGANEDTELLAQALLLTRGAFELCQSRWPAGGDLGTPPTGLLPPDPAAKRHSLIDWLTGRVVATAAAA
ncbi:MAG: hypothetical protein WCP21_10125 [Armatimonadota bacterium]